MKVLIIDDEEDIRQVVSLSLNHFGKMDVLEAESGEEGINKASSEKPDAILLDMTMPVMDGPTTLAALRENPNTKTIPVIFLTARAMNNEVERLKNMGAAGILTKPFDPRSLASQVESILTERLEHTNQ